MDSEQIKAMLKDPAKRNEHYEKMFALLDKDKKGYLEPEVVKNGLKERFAALGIPVVEMDKDKEDALIKAADPTGSGKVTLDGFKAACVAFRKAAHAIMKDPVKLEAEAKKIFEKLDKDKKGYLDVAVIKDIEENKLPQLKVPMPQLPKEKKEALLKLADPEGTGKITLENYLKMTKAVVEKMKADGLLED